MYDKDYEKNYEYVIQIYKMKSRKASRNFEVALVNKFKKHIMPSV